MSQMVPNTVNPPFLRLVVLPMIDACKKDALSEDAGI